jgi:hypothetical protein
MFLRSGCQCSTVETGRLALIGSDVRIHSSTHSR